MRQDGSAGVPCNGAALTLASRSFSLALDFFPGFLGLNLGFGLVVPLSTYSRKLNLSTSLHEMLVFAATDC